MVGDGVCVLGAVEDRRRRPCSSGESMAAFRVPGQPAGESRWRRRPSSRRGVSAAAIYTRRCGGSAWRRRRQRLGRAEALGFRKIRCLSRIRGC
jgi:hypothetical protein